MICPKQLLGTSSSLALWLQQIDQASASSNFGPGNTPTTCRTEKADDTAQFTAKYLDGTALNHK